MTGETWARPGETINEAWWRHMHEPCAWVKTYENDCVILGEVTARRILMSELDKEVGW